MKLTAQVREERGTRRARRIRRTGVIPGVLYGGGRETIPLGINGKELHAVLRGRGAEHAILDLKVVGAALAKPVQQTVIVKEVQRDHMRDAILHVDFAAISLTEKLTAKVPIVDAGEPVGVTQGGVLEQIIRELEVECLPADLPEQIVVDVSGLAIGQSINVGQITPPANVRVLNAPDLTVFTVSVPKAEKVEEAAPAEEAAAAEAAPAEGEEKKPEEGKKEEAKEKEGAKAKEKEQPKGKEKEPVKGREKG
jgi:large subunit ribosomal protein L25